MAYTPAAIPPGYRRESMSEERVAQQSRLTGMDELVSLCARRGFIFQSSEIYGGINGFWDYGPLGTELKHNLKALWWQRVVRERPDVEGIDTAIIAHPRTWEASGHVDNFTDPLVDCRSCKARFREDLLSDEQRSAGQCPTCGNKEVLTEPRAFNLMFKTQAGPVEGAGADVYLRPETAQGTFINFKNIIETSRKKPPFGIAQVGKSFRNEITPGNFVFRTREFEQMELEFFVPPAEADSWYEYWMNERYQWYLDLGVPADQLRLRAHEDDELSHYSSGTSDIEFLFPWGWGELE